MRRRGGHDGPQEESEVKPKRYYSVLMRQGIPRPKVTVANGVKVCLLIMLVGGTFLGTVRYLRMQ